MPLWVSKLFFWQRTSESTMMYFISRRVIQLLFSPFGAVISTARRNTPWKKPLVNFFDAGPDDYIIYCDIDEFQEYPAPLKEIVRIMDERTYGHCEAISSIAWPPTAICRQCARSPTFFCSIRSAAGLRGTFFARLGSTDHALPRPR